MHRFRTSVFWGRPEVGAPLLLLFLGICLAFAAKSPVVEPHEFRGQRNSVGRSAQRQRSWYVAWESTKWYGRPRWQAGSGGLRFPRGGSYKLKKFSIVRPKVCQVSVSG